MRKARREATGVETNKGENDLKAYLLHPRGESDRQRETKRDKKSRINMEQKAKSHGGKKPVKWTDKRILDWKRDRRMDVRV